MSRRVAVVAGNALTALGDLEQTWNGLLAGKTGLQRQHWDVVLPEYPLGLIDGLPGHGTTWPRLQSLFDRLFADLPVLAPETWLFIATTKGAVDEYLGTDPAPAGQPWQLADVLATRLGLTGSVRLVSAACASGTLALIQAAIAIRNGDCGLALVAGFDLVGDFILAGFDSLKALSVTTPKPFDRSRDGLALGDGGAWVLLAAEDVLVDAPLAWLERWGMSCDATHITAPCRYASGLKRTMNQLFQEPRFVGGINAHGTGTVYNDAMELVAFNELCTPGTPVCSVKGALGHSLGAAGVIEALLSVKSLDQMVLPPTVGLESAGEGRVSLSGEKSLELRAPTVLSCNSGFGGINGAILLCRPEIDALP